MPSVYSMLNQEKAALNFLSEIEAAGRRAYIVGGAVRDRLLGFPMKDIDIVSDMPMAELRKRFKAFDVGKSKDFGICVVLFGGYSFETAAFRGATRFDENGRPAGMGASATFAEDAGRRDFTINAMGMDARGKILDPFGGADDIERKLIRCVQNPMDRFNEDAIRLLRATRLAARLKFKIEDETKRAMRQCAGALANAAPERIAAEIIKMASTPGKSFAAAVELMDQTDLLAFVLPEIHALKGLPHDGRVHPEGGVFEHTMAAVSANREPDPLLNLAILLHDVGKAVSLDLSQGRPRYIGHERLGVEITANMSERLRFSNDWKNALCFTAQNHMKVSRLDKMTQSKVFNLISDNRWTLLKKVASCDQAARGKLFDRNAFDEIILQAEKEAFSWKEKLYGRKVVIGGKRVMALTGLAPGPKVGEIIKKVTAWAMDNNIDDESLIERQVIEIAENS